LKNMITNILPILLMVAYVSKVYTPQTLFDRFGHKWVLSLSFGQSHQMNISSLFWFVICLVFSFIIYSVLNIILKKGDKENGFA
ncbi:MAG: hypothetical protein GY729_05525, partial [Desulfobacteraceae bacterium]|nr:hypothetical protein [Desulfobacteraceae bacterium]